MDDILQLSLLEHIERIVELSEGSELSDKFYKEAGQHIDAVCNKLNINRIQSVIFAHLVDRNNDRSVYMREIAEKLKIRTVRLIQYQNDIDELEKRRLVRCNRSGESKYYCLPLEVLEAIQRGHSIQPLNRKNLSIEDFFDMLDFFFSQLTGKVMSNEFFAEEIDDFLRDNEQLTFAKKIMQYQRTGALCFVDLVLLMRFCNLYVENTSDHICLSDFEDCFETYEFKWIKRKLVSKESALLRAGLIEYVYDGGFEEREAYKLTDMAKDELLGELKLQTQKINWKKDILTHESLVAKQMYYNEKEQKQVVQLTDLLREENFCKVQERLKDKGMRTGFTCLFYGDPGTGKTETVYQIARQTGRNIFLVDISNTKSMWFGESEKKIKEVFEKYKTLVKAEAMTPILLFNEADAVIGKRKDVIIGAVAQTENAIQNIILQEMETLNGIMIATTNLTQNFDTAFERRFLYKIEFEKPNDEAKRHIWKLIIPTLQDSEAAELSRQFNFSGGQIENVARKCTVDSIISGEEPNMDRIIFHCKNELLTNNCKPIGFSTTRI
jgi:SpoVK/Ycf46/Vps4 family AAA+-type ATPase